MPLPLVNDYGDLEQWVAACINDPDFRLLPSTGGISMSMINTELGRPAAQSLALNDAAVRNMSLLGIPARPYNTPITMDSLRGATATVFVTSDTVRFIGTGVTGAFLGAGVTCLYNYRTGSFFVNDTFIGTGGEFGLIGNGEYNNEGLQVTNPVLRFFWEGNWYTVPNTQYPSSLNDWSCIWTIGGDFNTGGNAWIPHVYGGLKIG